MNLPHNIKTIFISVLVLATLIVGNYYRSGCKKSLISNLPTLKIGTNSEYPPYSFMDEHDQIVGFDIDVINEAARRMGYQTHFDDMAFDALLPKLQRGDIKIISAGMSPTPERAKKVLFTKPHFAGDPLIVITNKTEKPLTSLADLQGKELVVNEGYVAYDYFSGIKGPILTLLPAPIDGFLAVQKKLVYAFATSLASARPFFNHYDKNNFNIFEVPDAHENIAFALCPECTDLKNNLQTTLDAMEVDGTLHMLKKKWNLV